MFYTQHCNRRQTKESLCRVLFPSERNRLAKAVIYTEFDNSTNGWHGKHTKCVESSLFVNLFSSREKAVCKTLLKTIEDTLYGIFEEKILILFLSHNYFASV